MPETIQDLPTAIVLFRDKIRMSKQLANDAESFCEELEGLEELRTTPEAILDIIQEILEKEPDATLRRKFTDMIEVIKQYGSDISKENLLLRI